MVGRPEVLSQSLPSFRHRLSVLYQTSLNVSEQNCNVYWSKVWTQLTSKVKCAVYSTPSLKEANWTCSDYLPGYRPTKHDTACDACAVQRRYVWHLASWRTYYQSNEFSRQMNDAQFRSCSLAWWCRYKGPKMREKKRKKKERRKESKKGRKKEKKEKRKCTLCTLSRIQR